ncbi:hypothetical protein CONPUDRAFT_60817 [Coniophora puteana RWD-64-598 SS2]|uniref:Amine oxidase domain-containing protein n=1 Tax=Coniophora puteana (strain RWD-64-598) TaxID=741705 RepID=A0A5M3MGE1_CONPW|nr:uncharacterized protein CONPUDRAFT_60817 [Coniophora puteana RWD-64-598 SS2]EIW78309.1 hypothetical protein CONPUDRAFT_60817 [Coniophora puteana RWD-64-598 SS2]
MDTQPPHPRSPPHSVPDCDVYGFYGRNVLRDFDSSLRSKLPPGTDPETEPSIPSEDEDPSGHRIGILGAGIGGLYVALILDSLDITNYEIIEASDRVGGRLLTHHFSRDEPYAYYDAGAMRFPLPQKDVNGCYKNGVNRRLAKLIEYAPANHDDCLHPPLKSQLIPYYFSPRPDSKPGILYYNGTYARTTQKVKDDVVKPFTRLLWQDIIHAKDNGPGWQELMANDRYSMRGYMSFRYLPSVCLNLVPNHLPTNVIDYFEMLQGSTSSWDAGFTEGVLGDMAFARGGSNVDWVCFDGGSETLALYIKNYLQQRRYGRIRFKERVTAIKPQDPDKLGELRSEAHTYTHVFSTLPLPVLRTIDYNFRDLKLNVLQHTALRQLQYGPAVKVAIWFKQPWWYTELGIFGGQSFTDLPIRNVVYPSYGTDSETPSPVIIASYSRSSDAHRLSSLSCGDEYKNREALEDLVLRNLAELHSVDGKHITYEYLREQFRGLHVMDWSHNPDAMGAFAMFYPGNFSHTYPALICPAADDHLYFSSEAISPQHGWVVGALNSAWRSVYTYLVKTGQKDKLIEFKRLWGDNMGWSIPTGKTLVNELSSESPWYKACYPDDNLYDHFDLIEKAQSGGEVKF